MMRIDDTALRVPPTAANPDLVRFLRFAKFVETGLYETNEAIDILTRNISALQGEKMPPAPAIEKVKGYITRFGGTVTNVDEWGKKRLAYEIQKMHEAYYYFIQFESDSVCPNEVEAHIRIMEPVIRYLCVKAEA